MPAREQSGRVDRLGRTVRMGQLLEIYGSLLTKRQREFTRLHHNKDMSFGEIARDYAISRQAVHDAVRHAEAAMEQFESGLGLLAHGVGARAVAPGDRSGEGIVVSAEAVEPIMTQLEGLRRRLATQGIIYAPDEYVRVLDGVLDRLKALIGD